MSSNSSSQKRKRSETGPTGPTGPTRPTGSGGLGGPTGPGRLGRPRESTRPTTPVTPPPRFSSPSRPFSNRPSSAQYVYPSSPLRRQHRPSSPIRTLESAEAVLLAFRETGVEAEEVDFCSEAEEEEAFINQRLSESADEEEDEDEDEEEDEDEDEKEDEDKDKDKDEEEDKEYENKLEPASAYAPTNLARDREILIRILHGDKTIPKRWNLRRILATLVHHRHDRRLRTPYRQFREFSYRTMMVETGVNDRWPGALPKKAVDDMLDLRLRPEVEKRYR
ncbi:hypothetical protein MMC07_007446 [Pseudocyphellaria aurata]|nr:hypothetical protein [Pseudocyphellaria aurata]